MAELELRYETAEGSCLMFLGEQEHIARHFFPKKKPNTPLINQVKVLNYNGKTLYLSVKKEEDLENLKAFCMFIFSLMQIHLPDDLKKQSNTPEIRTLLTDSMILLYVFVGNFMNSYPFMNEDEMPTIRMLSYLHTYNVQTKSIRKIDLMVFLQDNVFTNADSTHVFKLLEYMSLVYGVHGIVKYLESPFVDTNFMIAMYECLNNNAEKVYIENIAAKISNFEFKANAYFAKHMLEVTNVKLTQVIEKKEQNYFVICHIEKLLVYYLLNECFQHKQLNSDLITKLIDENINEIGITKESRIKFCLALFQSLEITKPEAINFFSNMVNEAIVRKIHDARLRSWTERFYKLIADAKDLHPEDAGTEDETHTSCDDTCGRAVENTSVEKKISLEKEEPVEDAPTKNSVFLAAFPKNSSVDPSKSVLDQITN